MFGFGNWKLINMEYYYGHIDSALHSVRVERRGRERDEIDANLMAADQHRLIRAHVLAQSVDKL